MDKLRPEKQIVGTISQQQELISDLYNEHYEMLFKYACSILDNEELAEKVVQETFRTASMDIENLLKSDNIAGWLIEALQRVIISDLYKKHYEMLLNYACSVLRNRDVAEEVIQETFRVACENIDKLLKSENLAGWLVRALQFSIKRLMREKQKMSKYIARLPDDFDFDNIADEKAPDENVDILYGDLAQHKDFELLKEFAVYGRPIREIAKKERCLLTLALRGCPDLKNCFVIR